MAILSTYLMEYEAMKLCFYFTTICLMIFLSTNCASTSTSSVKKSGTNIENALVTAVEQAFKNVDRGSRIAVIHIQAPSNDLNNYLLGDLQHILVSKRYNLVDRVDLDKIRAERDFQYSSEVDDNTAVSLGKFVGADMVVTGGIDGVGTFRRLRLKVMETQTAVIRGTASVPYTQSNMLDDQQDIIPPPAVSVKIFVGGTSNSIKGLDTDVQMMFGYHIGGSLEIMIGQTPLKVEPGIRYITRGAKYDMIVWDANATCEDLYNYLDIFTKLKWEIPLSKNIAIQPFTGYIGNILLSATGQFEMTDGKTSNDIKSNCNTFTHMGAVGIDFSINNTFVIGGEYDIGISSIWKDGYSQITSDSILLNIGYKF